MRETKNEIEIQIGTMHIEPSIVAQGLELGPLRVQAMMRKGEITSLCECGVMRMRGGRSRLTFFHKSRRFRLIVDGTGTVLQRSIAEDRARTDS